MYSKIDLAYYNVILHAKIFMPCDFLLLIEKNNIDDKDNYFLQKVYSLKKV